MFSTVLLPRYFTSENPGPPWSLTTGSNTPVSAVALKTATASRMFRDAALVRFSGTTTNPQRTPSCFWPSGSGHGHALCSNVAVYAGVGVAVGVFELPLHAVTSNARAIASAAIDQFMGPLQC